ncbi:MAG: acyl-CoA thioesterase [Bdellovibrionota bacterium]
MSANKIFDYPLTILEKHLDTFGHVNNAVYLQILEEARWEIITANGYGMRKIQETGIGPVLLEVNLKFVIEMTLRQRIVIKTQLLSYEGKISVLRQWIEDEKGTLHCEARYTMGVFNTRERKLIPPPAEWLRAVGVEQPQ